MKVRTGERGEGENKRKEEKEEKEPEVEGKGRGRRRDCQVEEGGQRGHHAACNL